jgi:pimeloyl-ACP methyl ester carboxylesterase
MKTPACRALLAIVAMAAAPATTPAAGIAAAAPVPRIAWSTCPDAWVGQAAAALGERLQCGSLRVPYDHVAPDGRELDVGVVRVRAADPGRREGAIFFNQGGPGYHPGRWLASMAAAWSLEDATHPVHGQKRLLADRYDLVAVIPRGLVGSEPLRCLTGMPPRYAYLPTHLDDANWGLVLEEARAVLAACTAPPHARFVNTEQHAHDMEQVRVALGDARIHFFGISYGALAGAWYGALYPGRLGRMLLDSSFDFTHDYRAAVRLSMNAEHQAFVEDIVTPLLSATPRYGLGSDTNAVRRAIDGLPPLLREVGTTWITSTARLAAALHVANWLRPGLPPTYNAMSRRIQHATLDVEPWMDRRIRWDAHVLAAKLYIAPRMEPFFSIGPEGDAVNLVMACNDWPWTRGDRAIRASARQDAARYTSYAGAETLEELICSRWGASRSRAPSLAPLETAPPFLLVQSEKDTSTPSGGAAHIVARFANAHMLLVRRSNQHGIFNFTMSACIEATAARYLLTGALPTAARVVACDGTGGNPLDAIPGAPLPPASEPVAADPPAPASHDEL